MIASKENFLIIVVAVMMVWALFPFNPYGYYILLRWISCPILIYLAFQARESNLPTLVWVFGFFAILYNPICTVHLNRGIWSFINIATIAVLGVFSYLKYLKVK